MYRTVFLDRDGVINRSRPDYVKSWAEFELLPGAIDSLALLSRQGLDVIVLTNQSALGRHLVSREVVDAIHGRLANLVKEAGGLIRAFLVCPHTPADGCSCRKPAPGLYFQARDELGVDLATAVMIGDQPSDMEAAYAAGCGAVLIDPDGAQTDVAAPAVHDLRAAIELITSPSPSEAIILCGGLATRLKGALGDCPKAMAVIHGRPFLEWLLLGLATRGISRVVLATGYLADPIRNHFTGDTRFGLEVALAVESEPLGTGGAARLAVDGTSTSPVLVLNGDSYCRFKLRQMLTTHRGHKAKATLWLHEVDRSDRYGSVMAAKGGRVTGFHEKVAGAGAISAGVYLVERGALYTIPVGRAMSLEREFFPGLVGKGLYSVTGVGLFTDIGTPESLAEAERLLAEDLTTLERRTRN